jgi:hypothetical protein
MFPNPIVSIAYCFPSQIPSSLSDPSFFPRLNPNPLYLLSHHPSHTALSNSHPSVPPYHCHPIIFHILLYFLRPPSSHPLSSQILLTSFISLTYPRPLFLSHPIISLTPLYLSHPPHPMSFLIPDPSHILHPSPIPPLLCPCPIPSSFPTLLSIPHPPIPLSLFHPISLPYDDYCSVSNSAFCTALRRKLWQNFKFSSCNKEIIDQI